jgi:hypothetical protein
MKTTDVFLKTHNIRTKDCVATGARDFIWIMPTFGWLQSELYDMLRKGGFPL